MRRAGSKLYLIALLAFLAAAAPASAQARFPIAYVSVQRILGEADDAKAAAKELETLRAAKSKELAEKKQALDTTRLQIANAGGYFSSRRRAELVEVGRRQEAELQQATQQAQTEFQELGKKIQDRLRSELSTIVMTLARQRGYQYVLNQDTSVLVGPSGADLTSEVLAQLNANTAQREANAKAAAESGKQ